MTGQEYLDQWREPLDVQQRREIYEALLGVPEFTGFLRILKERQESAWQDAQGTAADDKAPAYDLGRASMIDEIRDDMVVCMADTVRRM